MSVPDESRDADTATVRAPGSRHFITTTVCVIGWVGLTLGALVFAVRIYRASTEGVPTLTWGAILFLAPLSYFGFGFFSILSAKFFARGQRCRGIGIVAGSAILPVLALTTTDYLYETSDRTADAELDSHDWVEFQVPTASISVTMPNQPTKERQILESAVGEIPVDMYLAEQGAYFFLVGVTDYSSGTVDASEYEFLVHMSDAAIDARSGSKLMSRRSIALDEWVGLEERVEMPGGRTGDLKPEHPVVAWQRYYQSDDRMIQFRILTLKSIYESGSAEFEAIATRFLNSIHLDAEASVESAPSVDR